MKKYRLYFSLFISIFTTSLLIGCGPKTVNVKSIQLSDTSINLYTDGYESINASVIPENASNKEVEWTSSDESIAYYIDGKVYAKNVGKTTLTATSVQNPNISSSCTITVKSTNSYTVSFIADSGIYAEQQVKGGEKAIKPVEPKVSRRTFVGWYDVDTLTKAYNFDDPVNADISLKAKFNDIEVETISLDPDEVKIANGSSVQLDVKYNPVDAFNKGITWDVIEGKDTVATVNNGLVVAKGAGTAKIKATSKNGKTAYCNVTVADITPATGVALKSKDDKTVITGGESLEFTASITPTNATIQRVKWSLIDNDNTEAKLERTGPLTATLVTRNKGGDVQIKASTIDGSSCVATFNLKIITLGNKINWCASPITTDNKTLYDLAKQSNVIIFGNKSKYETEINAGMQPKAGFTPLQLYNVAKGETDQDKAKIQAFYGAINARENRLYVVSDLPIIFEDGDRPSSTELGLFQNCVDASEIILENVDVNEMTNMSNLFYGDNLLKKVNLKSFDTEKMQNMSYMFYDCSALKSLNISSFKTDKVIEMSHLFSGCWNLKEIFVGDNFVTTNVQSDTDMFKNCKSLTGGLGTSYDDSKVNKEYARIDEGTSKKGYLTKFHQAKIKWKNTNIQPLGKSIYTVAKESNLKTIIFDKKYKYNEFSQEYKKYDIGEEGDVIEAYIKDNDTMYVLSNDLIAFEDDDKPDNNGMFDGFSSLKTFKAFNIDTSLLTSMAIMFKNCSNLENIDISSFDTNNVTEMNAMFYKCEKLKMIDLSSFMTFNLKNSAYMFNDCTSLHTIYTSYDFVVDDVTESEAMFKSDPTKGREGLVGGDGTMYDPNHVNKEYARVDYAEHGAPAKFNGYFTIKSRIALYDKHPMNENYHIILFEPGEKYYVHCLKNWDSSTSGVYYNFNVIEDYVDLNIDQHFNKKILLEMVNEGERVHRYENPYISKRVISYVASFFCAAAHLKLFFTTTYNCPKFSGNLIRTNKPVS